jgi:hypothetical protein
MNPLTFAAQSPATPGSIFIYGNVGNVRCLHCESQTFWHRDFQGRPHSPHEGFLITYEVVK